MLKFINIQINEEKKNICLQVDPETLPEEIIQYFKFIDIKYTGKFFIDVSFTRQGNEFRCLIDNHYDNNSFVATPCQIIYESSILNGSKRMCYPYVFDKKDAKCIYVECIKLLIAQDKKEKIEGIKVSSITFNSDAKMLCCQIDENTIPRSVANMHAEKNFTKPAGVFKVYVKLYLPYGMMLIQRSEINRDNAIIYNDKVYCDYKLTEKDISNILTACRQKLLNEGYTKQWMTDSRYINANYGIEDHIRENRYAGSILLDDIQEAWNVQTVRQLNARTPEGIIKDDDTIFEDIIEERDIEVSGIADEIFDIYQNSSDKRAVKALFETLTGTKFTDYIINCYKNITRK